MSASNPTGMPTTASTLFSVYASFAGSMMLVRSIADLLIPKPLRTYICSSLRYLFTPLSTNLTLVIDEYAGDVQRNQVYDAAELYLRAKIIPLTKRLTKAISSRIDQNQELVDTFENIKLEWKFVSVEPKNGGQNYYTRDKLRYELSFHRKHKDKVMECYLPYVLAKAEAIREEQKVLKLYTLGTGSWESMNIEDPTTFETLAMEPEMKKRIIVDLDRFVRGREFYKKVGKAWKRGYLLYGPPGTGKSSLIAAMANYLNFSIYYLELSSISSNTELRKALLSTSNRSIMVIEDIDCSVELQNREAAELTLSGLLNFIDCLWWSCADQRIIVFATNHKDRLDPALLRPGRMDVHIDMFCTAGGFNSLASNYLGIRRSNRHRLCGQIEGLIESTEVTPSEVAEVLMKIDDADVALEGLVSSHKRKKVERNEEKKEGDNEVQIQETKRQKMETNVNGDNQNLLS